jgi:hypothetical protein
MTEDSGVNISDSVVMGDVQQNIANTCPACQTTNIPVMVCQYSGCETRFCEICHKDALIIGSRMGVRLCTNHLNVKQNEAEEQRRIAEEQRRIAEEQQRKLQQQQEWQERHENQRIHEMNLNELQAKYSLKRHENRTEAARIVKIIGLGLMVLIASLGALAYMLLL